MNKYQEALNGVQILPQKVVVRKIEDEMLMEKYYLELQELVDKATPIKLNRVICKTQISKYSTRIEHKAYCPICNTRILIEGNCCSNNDCRQALDWSRDDNPHR